MFRRVDRLPRAAFARAGPRASSPNLRALAPRGARGYAVVVSKKTARRAVDRTRIKRRVRALLKGRALPPALIVYPSAAVLSLPRALLAQELTLLLSKIAAAP